ncbi:hypothetical protein MTsPCn9_04050 [Croceitalea sp. MTPC9]|uniref:hypothetical protein n=1 Tax=unclassified Croceitalea TaxID=2632280 RepID=UPI002B3A759D|nr:hypothetical protein MTsPCn6_04660 [Croceitalea sp. MTPC6]GMN15469.1 hypothetical protein MTsPCn9_04050 [Croceitalea sp. MTPC9]
MKRWVSFLGHLVIIVVLTSFGKKVVSVKEVTLPESSRVTGYYMAEFPKPQLQDVSYISNTIFLKKGFQGFKEAVAFKESQGDYKAINTLGYLGKYQFGINTLKLMGVYNSEDFLNNPILQENIFELNVSRNKWILRRDIKRFVGKRINGTVISESGIVAAAHLAGAGNVKKYLRSYGKNDFSDAYGTTVAHYIKKFGGYDTSLVKPIHNPRI